jgi:D-aspartate ligase
MRSATATTLGEGEVHLLDPGRRPALRDRPPAVVIGLDCVTGLQTARILAGHGIPVIGVAANPRHPCCRTRVCERIVATDTSGPALIDTLVRLGPSLEGAAVLVPCTDLSVLLTSRHREQLSPWFLLSLPDAEVVEMLVDKARFHLFAEREGLPVPPTRLLRSAEDAAEAARELRFPLILKPSVKSPEWSRRSAAKVHRVTSPVELRQLYDRFAGAADCLIVQEWIEGTDTDHYTCNCYFDAESEPLVTFTTRKLRQWPLVGGEACLGEESRNETVEAETVRLFRTARHRGLGYLEMKQDVRTGEYLIVEPNIGRPTGRSATAEAAGVELLHTMYCDTLGRPLPARRRQEFRGVKWIHLRRDLQSAFTRWRRGELTLADWLRSVRGPKREALFSWRDPVPFWADLARVALDAARHRSEGRRWSGGS